MNEAPKVYDALVPLQTAVDEQYKDQIGSREHVLGTFLIDRLQGSYIVPEPDKDGVPKLGASISPKRFAVGVVGVAAECLAGRSAYATSGFPEELLYYVESQEGVSPDYLPPHQALITHSIFDTCLRWANVAYGEAFESSVREQLYPQTPTSAS